MNLSITQKPTASKGSPQLGAPDGMKGMKKNSVSMNAALSGLAQISDAQLRDNHACLEALLDCLPLAVFIRRDGDDQPLVRNRAARALARPLVAALFQDDGSVADSLFAADGATLSANALPAAHMRRGDPLAARPYLWRDADGKETFLEISLSFLADASDGRRFASFLACTDITAQREAQLALECRERRYRELFENANDIIYTHDFTGVITSFNRAATHLLGYTEADMPLSIADIVSPEDRDKAYAQMAKRISGEETSSYELIVVTKTGEKRTLEVNPRLMIEGGKPVGIQGVARDISERKRQEEKLLMSQREWRTTFDAIPDSIVLTDPDDYLLRANKAFFERNNLTEESARGRTVRELIHTREEYLSGDICPICDIRATHEGGTIELPPGVVTDYPLLASIVPLFDENGDFLATLQVVRDLTALYSAREEAEQERVSLNATIEQMAEGLVIVDEHARVLRVNSSAQQLFGFSREEFLSDRLSELMEGRYTDRRGNSLSRDERPIRAALRERRTIDNQVLVYMRPDDRRIFLSITASPFFSEHGRLAGAVALVRDVTAQQKEQERLLQADKLRALGQLASGVAHNFNNALAAIMGYSQLAIRKTADVELQKYLRIVEQSSKDAARMVERIQNFSRTRSKKDEFVSVRIVDIVRDAIDITRPRWRNDAEALGIKYSVALDWQAPDNLCVRGESSELREVFVNILLNSLDAMPEGGSISIAGTTANNQIKITFKDVGVGMTEEVRSRVFEPFFTTKGAAGLGLGLSESYRIAERHKGLLEVESEPQRGTIFTLTLPVLVLKTAHVKRQSGEYALPKKRFMVVDDEEVVRYAFALVLEDLGHEVARAASAQEALELLKRGSYDIVFTDLAMPDVDGIATAKQIKAQLPNAKIVLMSGYSFDKVQERAKETTCIDATMAKPFNIPEIQKLIQRLLE